LHSCYFNIVFIVYAVSIDHGIVCIVDICVIVSFVSCVSIDHGIVCIVAICVIVSSVSIVSIDHGIVCICFIAQPGRSGRVAQWS
jgi:hypothetical protein